VISASCGETGTSITVDLDIDAPLPDSWAGWVVDRMVIGPCADMQPIFGPVDFPAEIGSWTFPDPGAPAGIACKYLLRAADAQGHRTTFDEAAFTDPWTAFTYTTCNGAAAVRGTLGGTGGGRTWMFTCGDGCWEFISYVENLPAELAPLVGTDTIVELVGVLHMGSDGPTITDVTTWRLPGACNAVATARDTWGGGKARYR
jgi:hypothetical protein